MKKNLRYYAISMGAVMLFVFVWYLFTDVFKAVNTLILPSPIDVFKAFVRKMGNTKPDGATLPEHAASSLKLVVLGYALGVLAGMPIGILMGWSRRFDRFFRPLFDLFRPVPPIGWIPLVLLLFGIGMSGKVFIIFFSTLMPCILSAYSGIKQVSPTHLEVARTFGATNAQRLFFVAIPSAMPMLFTGLRVALSTSWGTLVAAEMLAAQKGLGYMIQMNRTLACADNIIVGMLLIGVIGAALSMLLGLLEKGLTKGR